MDIHTQVAVAGVKPAKAAYETVAVVRYEQRLELVEFAGVTLDELEPAQIDAIRERLHGALKEAGKQLDADLDWLEEMASERAAKARREQLRVAKEEAAAEAEKVSEF